MALLSPRLIFALLAVPAGLRAADAVAVSATAIKDYVRATDSAGRPVLESYVFAEGRFFGGRITDRGLEKTAFADIARALVPNLAKQNYFPVKPAAEADLLLMVHWGATDTYEDPQREFTVAAAQEAAAAFSAAQQISNIADPTALNFELNAMATARQSARSSIDRNAVLLGYARNLLRERRAAEPTTAEITMSQELNEERYFVIVMAYDNRTVKKDHKARPLWITRLSIRSPGNNFTGALPVLAEVGAEVFGHHFDDLIKVKASDPHGSVKLHELEIKGAVAEPPPPANPPATPK